MNIQTIKNQVAQIYEERHDDKIAHIHEDDLHEEFISYIASGDFGELSIMAKEVLKTQAIAFARWCS